MNGERLLLGRAVLHPSGFRNGAIPIPPPGPPAIGPGQGAAHGQGVGKGKGVGQGVGGGKVAGLASLQAMLGAFVAVSSTGAVPSTPPVLPVEYSYVEKTSNTSITATSEATATTIVTAAAVTFDGVSACVVEFFASAVQVPTTAECVIVLYLDGATAGFMGDITSPSAGTQTLPVLLRRRVVPTAGSHTFSIRAYRVTTNCTVNAGVGGAGAYLPAYIRITP